MKLEDWLRQNENSVDWNVFSTPWDAMQLKHNPFRNEQIQAILDASEILNKNTPKVLDIGCGPGILGRKMLEAKPSTRYVGIDGDPVVLEAMRHLLKGSGATSILADFRRAEWTKKHLGQFDAVVSLTALHWLSQQHQKAAYRAAFDVLKPGGTLTIGDPYVPQGPDDRKILEAIQQERMMSQTGQTWEEFWQRFFETYPIKDVYTAYHREKGYQEPFEGSDDGYPLEFHLNALREAGFRTTAVYWKNGLRAVYGGKK